MKNIDYIYKNSDDEKCVGTIKGLKVTPLFDFNIEVNGKPIWCQMDHCLAEWCIHFISINRSTDIAHPADILWNTEKLCEIFENEDICRKVAYAIKAVYEKVYHP